jgi:lipoprotein-releasing system permease protein
LVVVSWKEQYPALVSSLKLEKYVMFLVIALITLVACMNMISLLFMQIQQKRHDIAIFRAMGLATKHIHDIFIRMGLVITTAASLCGLAAATAIGYWIEKHPVIELPDVYYVSHLPARVDLDICVIVFFVTVFLGFIATWIPARRTKYINIVDVLRQE